MDRYIRKMEKLNFSVVTLRHVFLWILNFASISCTKHNNPPYTIKNWNELSNEPLNELQTTIFKTIERGILVPPHDNSNQPNEWVGDALRLYQDKFVNDDEGGHDLQKYNPEVLPIDKEKRFVDIETIIYLMKIVDFDVEEQTLELVFWLELVWYDKQIKWDPEDYGGLKTIKVKPSTIWIPDLVLTNSATERFQLTEDASTSVNCHLYHNGAIRWIPIVTMTLSCPLNLGYFPWDYQSCYMQLGSWAYTYDRVRLHLIKNETDLSYYTENHTWDVVANYAVSIVPPHRYQNLKFIFTLSRDPNQYVITIVFTCLFLVLISGLSFIVPCSSGERLSATLAIVIAISVYQMVAMDILPKGSDTLPILSYFVAAQLYMVFFCVIITMLALWIEGEKQPFRPNKWVYYAFVRVAGRLLFVRRTREWIKLEDDYGFLKSTSYENLSDVLEKDEIHELRKLEWLCLKKSIERLSMILYWALFIATIIVIFSFGNYRENQMKGEFDKMFNNQSGLAYN